jgi:S-adenosylmethionine hydrolase
MRQIERIALITDFGSGGPYIGQMMLRLADLAPGVGVVDLVSDLPPFRPDLAAYLLPALVRDVPEGTLFLCVVDPGVGGERAAIASEADGRWYVGPDNGLFVPVIRRATRSRTLRVNWRPGWLSESFHGRDLFCPIAAMLARGVTPDAEPVSSEVLVGNDWPVNCHKVIYRDRYGNLMTGLGASAVSPESRLIAAGRDIGYARTFCEVAPGEAFWYVNSLGLVEIAVNQGRADGLLGLAAGDAIDLTEGVR